MVLADRVQDRANFLTPVRLVLAALVVLWHGAVIAGGQGAELNILGFSQSEAAVNGFFILSGFLIAHSAQRRDLAYYAAARILRLYPALIALLLCGALYTLLMHVADPAMGSQPGSWLYLPKSLIFLDASGTYPGLFAGNPRQEFDLSLWTLRYEALAYLALPAALMLGLLSRARRVWALWAALAAAYGLVDGLAQHAPAIVHEGLRLGSAFLLGVAIHASRARLRAGRAELAVALGAALALAPTPLFSSAANLLVAWAIFFVGFAPAGRLGALTRMPDWSYGLYIWHWPVFQAIKMAVPQADATLLLTLGFAVALGFAAFSWHFIEQPALAGKVRLAVLLRRLVPPLAAAPAA